MPQFTFLMLLATIIRCLQGDAVEILNNKPRCGDWIPLKDDKCIKVTDEAILRNQRDAEATCEGFSEDLKRESFPKLITIKSQEEQEFLQKLLAENNIVENVWLGLKEMKNDEGFIWNDGSEMVYSNLANQTSFSADHHCVELASGSGGFVVGSWIKVNCQRRNRVICERKQTWSLETLQNMFLAYKSEAQKEILALRLANDTQLKAERVHEQQIATLREEISMQLNIWKNNSVPVGFIYVQLPEQQPPTALWPQVSWSDVTSTYAGLFFRAEGGNAAPFGQVQDENNKRLFQVQQFNGQPHINPLAIPSDGTWSATIHTGIVYNAPISYRVGTRFRLSTDEVRPRNQAVKIWRRIE